ncbi:LuxR C-terminal-related transcriptional regulator [Paenibacillus koleovorans]|uniref:LuxR C-terminal-related transcriptional regulator n=1 Tax=Paenibacillus koleovorans TaxID=121608 RepID=UPI000FD8CC5A|nr:LuxR C-terminal-related transcriptional regulator [Paenibacillus koleovorans]
MNPSILATKLYIPASRTQVVPRQRLIDRLNENPNRKLTLISASAGFGKTTLVSEWAASCGMPVAWLSLDEGDQDSSRFLAHLVAALQTVAPPIGAGAIQAIQSPQPPTTESMLTSLLNELSALPYRMLLVLDDYHVLEANWIDHAIGFLLEHLPPQLHLAIATRENPQLPLGRLRAMGQLTELRDADLRFTPEEAAAFLNEAMGLNLAPGEMKALETRTEGWIAGLQLAALSMKGRKDIPAFIREFAGDNRYIMDYLVEEVLQRQPESIRSFLLQTSILDRLHGPLCDAITGQEDGFARLQSLEQGSFFIVPLDDRRQWYRYHHLFAEVLSAHLRSDQPDQAAALHRRASLWYEQQGLAEEAIRHALTAEDFARAASLIEQAIPALRRSRRESAMLGWLQPLPDALIRDRPVLCVWYAGALLAGGKLDAVEARLRDAERWLEPEAMGTARGLQMPVPPPSTSPLMSMSREAANHEREQAPPSSVSGTSGMVVVDEEEFRRLPGLVAVYRAGLALILGDVPAVMKHAQRVLDLVPADDHLPRGAATALMGLAYWRSGELERAHRMFADGIAHVQLAGAISDAINGAIAIAEIHTAQGRLREAKRAYERGLQLAADHGEPDLRGTADIYVGLSELYRERDDLDAAAKYLLKSKEQGEHTGFPQYRYRWHVAMARIQATQGNGDSALNLLHEAERLYVHDFFLDARPAAALKARVWIAQGRLSEALDWAREQSLSASDEPSYLREFEYITLVRVLLAQYKSNRADRLMHEATALLERLLRAAEEGGRAGSAIEIRIVLALTHQVRGDIPTALVQLEHALTVAEPEGYVRVFADEGRPMAALLEEAAKRSTPASPYARRLLTAIGRAEISVPQPTSIAATLPEPLSERELDVLRLLKTDLSGPDIARELMVSLNTLRTHTKHIYDKLQVNSRRTAVRRAEELGLI